MGDSRERNLLLTQAQFTDPGPDSRRTDPTAPGRTDPTAPGV